MRRIGNNRGFHRRCTLKRMVIGAVLSFFGFYFILYLLLPERKPETGPYMNMDDSPSPLVNPYPLQVYPVEKIEGNEYKVCFIVKELHDDDSLFSKGGRGLPWLRGMSNLLEKVSNFVFYGVWSFHSENLAHFATERQFYILESIEEVFDRCHVVFNDGLQPLHTRSIIDILAFYGDVESLSSEVVSQFDFAVNVKPPKQKVHDEFSEFTEISPMLAKSKCSNLDGSHRFCDTQFLWIGKIHSTIGSDHFFCRAICSSTKSDVCGVMLILGDERKRVDSQIKDHCGCSQVMIVRDGQFACFLSQSKYLMIPPTMNFDQVNYFIVESWRNQVIPIMKPMSDIPIFSDCHISYNFPEDDTKFSTKDFWNLMQYTSEKAILRDMTLRYDRFFNFSNVDSPLFFGVQGFFLRVKHQLESVGILKKNEVGDWTSPTSDPIISYSGRKTILNCMADLCHVKIIHEVVDGVCEWYCFDMKILGATNHVRVEWKWTKKLTSDDLSETTLKPGRNCLRMEKGDGNLLEYVVVSDMCLMELTRFMCGKEKT